MFKKQKLPDITYDFTEENIFNVDETGVHYHQLPSRSLIEKEFAKSVMLLDAIHWIHGAWKDLSQETIVKFFRHARFLLEPREGEKDNTIDETNVSDELRCLPEVFRIELPDIDVLGNFGNILEVHDDVSDTIEGVLKVMMKMKQM
ncbi:hypothetical protein ANN_26896 [Periplaneta americana]|uniref:DDE-1 domain-containing protein n=1 Tax=Periplaneta americana TaxID=6978 RepID=A0ABQ8RWI2_PERAM|nr:hypothetical protein ANN_26896 [Periplaneta americana]